MIFDKLAGIAERQMHPLRPILKSSRLFKFEGRAHEVLPKEFDEKMVEQITETFFLPYAQVFMEDSASGVLLGDYDDEQRGLSGKRFYLVALPLDGTNEGEFSKEATDKALEVQGRTTYIANAAGKVSATDDSGIFYANPLSNESYRSVLEESGMAGLAGIKRGEPITEEHWAKVRSSTPKGTCLIIAGDFFVPEVNTKGMQISCTVHSAFIGNKDRITEWHSIMVPALIERVQRESTHPIKVDDELIMSAVAHEKKSLTHEVVSHVHTAIEEVLYFNTPDRFVLETSVANPKVRKGKAAKGKVLRSNERPQYTLLHPRNIREVMGVTELAEDSGEKRKVRPHERRRHYRTYTSDRYKAAKGRTVVIPASWIGPDEAVVGTKRYRVCLEV